MPGSLRVLPNELTCAGGMTQTLLLGNCYRRWVGRQKSVSLHFKGELVSKRADDVWNQIGGKSWVLGGRKHDSVVTRFRGWGRGGGDVAQV